MDDLKTLAATLHGLVAAEDYDALQAPGLLERLLSAVREADLYLTGKTGNRGHDLERAVSLLEGETWEIYLSDGGYSRLVIQIVDPDAPSLWLDRELSLPRVVERWNAS